MGETKSRRDARQRALELRRATGDEVRRMRLDAGLSAAVLARAAGIDPAYLPHIERGEQEPSLQVLAALGGALGADLSIRYFPRTGPLIHDRTQAPMRRPSTDRRAACRSAGEDTANGGTAAPAAHGAPGDAACHRRTPQHPHAP